VIVIGCARDGFVAAAAILINEPAPQVMLGREEIPTSCQK
jgi:hypothetical protein